MAVDLDQRSSPSPVVVLASGSPRRLDLLRRAGIEPAVLVTEVDETPLVGESPEAMVLRLAEAKVRATWEAGLRAGHRAWSSGSGTLVVAADTTVEVDGESLGKPVDADDARRMLRQLSGRAHRAITGVAVLHQEPAGGPAGTGGARPGPDGPALITVADHTVVVFRTLTDDDVEWYVGTGEPFDKAGSYTIQGLGSWMVKHMEGSYHNVVGLPVAALDALTRSIGWPLRALATRAVEAAA